jgi:hypothetical protein
MPGAREIQAHTISVRRCEISLLWEPNGSQIRAYHGLILDSGDFEGGELRGGHCVMVVVVVVVGS